MNVIKMTDLDLAGKRVLIREDLNAPVKDGKVTSDARIQASLPTIRLAMEKGAKVMLMSHLGRPEEGVAFQTILDLEQTARLLAILLDSGRSVINENQPLFDDPVKGDKGFTPEVFQRQLADMFRSRSGVDLADLDSARIPPAGKKWLKALLDASKNVVEEAQPDINRPAARSPACIWARR